MSGLGATPGTAEFVASPDLIERAASWRDDDPDEVTRAELGSVLAATRSGDSTTCESAEMS